MHDFRTDPISLDPISLSHFTLHFTVIVMPEITGVRHLPNGYNCWTEKIVVIYSCRLREQKRKVV